MRDRWVVKGSWTYVYRHTTLDIRIICTFFGHRLHKVAARWHASNLSETKNGLPVASNVPRETAVTLLSLLQALDLDHRSNDRSGGRIEEL